MRRIEATEREDAQISSGNRRAAAVEGSRGGFGGEINGGSGEGQQVPRGQRNNAHCFFLSLQPGGFCPRRPDQTNQLRAEIERAE